LFSKKRPGQAEETLRGENVAWKTKKKMEKGISGRRWEVTTELEVEKM